MRISVAMAVYNGQSYLKEQLDSIKRQTKKVNEIVIIDDCSQNPCDEIINDFISDSDIDVKYLKHAENNGYAKTFFEALKNTTGDFVFLSDQDDVWDEDKVEKMVNVAKEKNIMCLSSLNHIVNQDCSVVRDEQQKEKLRKIHIDSLLRGTSLRPGMSLVISKELIKQISSLNTDVYFAHDRFIEFVACLNGNFYCMNECLTKYRIHSSNTSGLNLSKTKLRSNRIGRIKQADKEIAYLKNLLLSNLKLSSDVVSRIQKYLSFYNTRVKALNTGLLRYLFFLPRIVPHVSSGKIMLGDFLSLYQDHMFI